MKQITIKMPKQMLTKWLAALRSGTYTQGRHYLRTSDGGYCCLGVLQHCLTGEVESDPEGCPELTPSLKWLDARGIKFSGSIRDPEAPGVAPYLPTINKYATVANDNGSYNFNQIADAIEACAEGT